MNLIADSIKKGWHKCQIEDIDNQSWIQFDEVAEGRKLILYGVTVNAVSYFMSKYGEKYAVSYVIDNSEDKKGKQLSDFCYCFLDKDFQIVDSGIFETLDSCEYVVLVLGFRRYPEIINELRSRGFEQAYSFLSMESKLSSSTWFSIEKIEEEFVNQIIKENPICPQKIVGHSMGRFGDHGKYIVKALLAIRKDLDIVWLVDKVPSKEVQGVRFIEKNQTIKKLFEYYTASVVLDDYLAVFGYKKRSGQLFVETKHWSSLTLKTFGLTLERSQNIKSNITICEKLSRIIDKVVVGSQFDEKTCKEGFNVENEYLHFGSPRTDILFNGNRTEILEKIGLEENIHYLIYAPTFRTVYTNNEEEKRITGYQSVHMQIDYECLKKALERKFDGEWKILLRLHPVIAKESKKYKMPDYVIDVSEYYDSQELIFVSDILMTDYSSIMFEPAFVGKTVLLYAPDINEYLSGQRSLLLDFNELPFEKVSNNKELIDCILEFDSNAYAERVKNYISRYDVHEDGYASERTARYLCDYIDGKLKDKEYYEKLYR